MNTGFWAPADNFDKKYFQTRIASYSSFFHDEKIYLPKNLLKKYGSFAGTVSERSDDFNELLKNKTDKIIGVRGGFGSMKTLKNLDYSLIKNLKPKIFGYSDLTSVLIAVNSICDLITFHGYMLSTDYDSSVSNDYLKILSSDIKKINYQISPKPLKLSNSKNQNIKGVSIAGCLSLLTALTGTEYFNQVTKKNLMFIEDIGEEPYRIDRMFSHLELAGTFKNTQCLFVDFKDCISSEKNKKNHSIKKILTDVFKDYNFPVYELNCFGHRHNRIIIPVGAHTEFTDPNSLNFSL